jgi:hypothetical protein
MIRKLIALGVGGAAALVAMTVSAPAQAQGTVVNDRLDGEGIKLIFSADRLFGLNWHKYTIKEEWTPAPGQNGTVEEHSHSGTSFSLLWPNTAGYSYYPNLAAIPRLSFDAKVFMGLTVGGSLGFMAFSGTYAHEKTRGNALEADEDYSGNAFLFAPRVGWILMFTDIIGLWPRLAIDYYTAHNEARYTVGGAAVKNKTSIWGLGASVEVPLIIAPVSHFAFTAGPVFDWYPLGKADSKREPPDPTPDPYPLKDTKVSLVNIGFTFGLMGWF